MGTSCTSEPGFGRKGLYALFRWYNHCGVEYRTAVAPHTDKPNLAFVLTLFRTDLGLAPGKNYRKFEGQDLVYEFPAA